MSKNKNTTSVVVAKKETPKNPLHPIFEVEKLFNEKGEVITPRYFLGQPRDYRLDMGLGGLCLGSQKGVIKGMTTTIKVIPIAVRCLEGKVFVKKEKLEKTEAKKWFEVYFINEAGHLSLFMFHGYSVDNLSAATKELLYEGSKLTQAVWTILLTQKKNKDGDTYHMGFFSLEALSEGDQATMKEVYNNITDRKENNHIYRDDTKKYTTLYKENWSDGSTPTAQEIEAAKALEAKKLAEFEPKEKGEKTTEAKPNAAKAA